MRDADAAVYLFSADDESVATTSRDRKFTFEAKAKKQTKGTMDNCKNSTAIRRRMSSHLNELFRKRAHRPFDVATKRNAFLSVLCCCDCDATSNHSKQPNTDKRRETSYQRSADVRLRHAPIGIRIRSRLVAAAGRIGSG